MRTGDTVTGWGPCRWTVTFLYDEATTWPCEPCPLCGGDNPKAARDCPRCDYGDVERYGPGRLMAHIACDTHPTSDQDWRHGHGPVAVHADCLTVVTAPEHHAAAESEDATLLDLLGGAA